MKFFGFLSILFICLGSSSCNLNSTHRNAVNKFKEVAPRDTTAAGDLYIFEDIFVANSEYSGGCFFLYSETKDIFELGCYFDSYNSRTSVTEGFVYCDFKWGTFKKQTFYFDLITYDDSNNTQFCYIKCEFYNIEIANKKITGDYKYSITYTYYPNDNMRNINSVKNAFTLITQAFNYGKTIMDRYNLSSFF